MDRPDAGSRTIVRELCHRACAADVIAGYDLRVDGEASGVGGMCVLNTDALFPRH